MSKSREGITPMKRQRGVHDDLASQLEGVQIVEGGAGEPKKERSKSKSPKAKNPPVINGITPVELPKEENVPTLEPGAIAVEDTKTPVRKKSRIETSEQERESRKKKREEKHLKEKSETQERQNEIRAGLEKILSKMDAATERASDDGQVLKSEPDKEPEVESTPNKEIEGQEVKNFVAEMGLESMLPKDFYNMSEAGQTKVVRDLEQRVFALVKGDAKIQYSEALQKRFDNLSGNKLTKAFKKIGINFGEIFKKEKKTKDLEKETFIKLIHSDGGKGFIAENLETLTEHNKNKNIEIIDGKPVVSYLDKTNTESWTSEEKSALERFNLLANEFHSMPYELGQQNNREYLLKQKAYEEAREQMLAIKAEKESDAEKGKAMLEMMQIDHMVLMEQTLNTHPEFQKELQNMTRGGGFKEYTKGALGFLNKASGSNWTNRMLIAGGYSARMLAKGAATLTATTGLTAIAAPIIGATIGGIRGRLKGKEILAGKDKEARYGVKDKNKEAKNVVDSKNLAKRLEDLTRSLEKDLDQAKPIRLDQIKRRIAYTQEKIQEGLVNFGNDKEILKNQYALINNLNKALVLAGLEGTTQKNIDERLEQFLAMKEEGIEKNRKSFLKKQAIRGALAGAGFATAGYVARWAGEELGWWGGGNGDVGKTPPTDTEGRWPPIVVGGDEENNAEYFANVEKGDGVTQTLKKILEDGKAPKWFQSAMGENPTPKDWANFAERINAYCQSDVDDSLEVTTADQIGFNEDGSLLIKRGGQEFIFAKPLGDSDFEAGDWDQKMNNEKFIDTDGSRLSAEESASEQTQTQVEAGPETELEQPGEVVDAGGEEATSGNGEELEKPGEVVDVAEAEKPGVEDAKPKIRHKPFYKISGHYNSGVEDVPTPTELSEALKIQVDTLYQDNLSKIFPDKMEVWQIIKNNGIKAETVINMNLEDVESAYKPLVVYLRQLEEVTGLKPKVAGEMVGLERGENVDEYMKRTLKWAAEHDKLDKLKFNYREVINSPSNPEEHAGPDNSPETQETKVPESEVEAIASKNMDDVFEKMEKQYGKLSVTYWGTEYSGDEFIKMATQMPANIYLGRQPGYDLSNSLYDPMIDYIKKLHKITGLEPTLEQTTEHTSREETFAQYIKRATEWAIKNGKLSELDVENVVSTPAYDNEYYDPDRR